MSKNHSFTRGLNGFSLFVVGIFIFSLLTPAAAAPGSMTEPAGDQAGLTAIELFMAEVAAPKINEIFDLDGVIIVDDMTDTFTPSGTAGEAFLQTRLFPEGETGTMGAGLFAYLYRVDLRNLVSSMLPVACVSRITIPFSPVVTVPPVRPVPLDYNLDDKPEDYFVISLGGALGSIAPTSVMWDPEFGNIIIEFKDPVCSGTKENPGESSFFIGFAAGYPYKPASGELIISPEGSQIVVDTRVPLQPRETGCFTLADPSGIPSPALINFDTLPDQTYILNHYAETYGVTFIEGAKTYAIEKPIAPSTPNVAYMYSLAANLPMRFLFAEPVSHVGFYAGNQAEIPVGADVIARDGQGTLICQFRTTLPALEINSFVGFYDPSQRIAEVEFSIPQNPTPEILDDLMFSPGGGGERIEFPRAETPLAGDGPDILIRSSSNIHFKATFELPDPSLWMEEQPDSDMRRLRFAMPGSEINGNMDGYPDIPFFRRLIAIPEGATPVLDHVSIIAGDQFLADLYPSQPSAVDADEWGNPPYTIDWEAYKSQADFPPSPVMIYPVGKMRDLNLALLVVAGGQYNPAARRLTIFDTIDFDILFEGGSGIFLPDYSNNPFEPAIRKQYTGVLNEAILGSFVGENFGRSCLGQELMIITHPDFREAADTLAAWKIEKGISTKVVEKSTPDGDTPAQIKQMIKTQYDTCDVRPSYVLIIGDSEFIGAFYHPYYDAYQPNKNAYSDIDYALMTEGDTFPDLAYGRIPVDTLEQANTVVNKIIAYESDPPDQTTFYNKVALASFFECCSNSASGKAWDDRSFVETSEIARSALVAGGKTVTRIYYSSTPGTLTPAYYRNGASLPSAIGYGSGYAWDGDTADVIAAFNSGTGLIMHRGHGGWTGWADPSFHTDNLSSLTNGNLTPVVYSVNCASGLWDNELLTPPPYIYPGDISWIEAILRMEGGAVAIIGDVRNSPTWANSALARGLFDATWPSTDPLYGTSTSHRRLGDILNYAKLYMYAQVSIPQTAGEVTDQQYEYNNYIYHVIGDPSMAIWKNKPPFSLVHQAVFIWGGITPSSLGSLQAYPVLTIAYPVEGAEITILQNGQPVGRGTVVGGLAEITFVADVDPLLPLQVSACTEDDICVMIYGYSVYLPVIKR